MSTSFDDMIFAILDSQRQSNAAVIRGEAVPTSLESPVTIRCAIQGIRYNNGFAQELHGRPELPQVTRALNTRALMSNQVPN
jgi:hypothetical protein